MRSAQSALAGSVQAKAPTAEAAAVISGIASASHRCWPTQGTSSRPEVTLELQLGVGYRSRDAQTAQAQVRGLDEDGLRDVDPPMTKPATSSFAGRFPTAARAGTAFHQNAASTGRRSPLASRRRPRRARLPSRRWLRKCRPYRVQGRASARGPNRGSWDPAMQMPPRSPRRLRPRRSPPHPALLARSTLPDAVLKSCRAGSARNPVIPNWASAGPEARMRSGSEDAGSPPPIANPATSAPVPLPASALQGDVDEPANVRRGAHGEGCRAACHGAGGIRHGTRVAPGDGRRRALNDQCRSRPAGEHGAELVGHKGELTSVRRPRHSRNS